MDVSKITKKDKCLFYHIPKTGGSSIYEIIKSWKNIKRTDPNKNHVRVCTSPPKWGYGGVAIVRHPHDRFVSAFYHMVDSCRPNFYYRNSRVDDCEILKSLGIGKDFGKYYNYDPNRFLFLLNKKDALTSKIFNTFSIFKSQYYWLKSFWGGIHHGIKLIIPYENMENTFNELAHLWGETADWEKSVNSRISDSGISLDQESKKIINELYKDDFKYLIFERVL